MFIGRRPDGTIYGCWTSEQPQDVDHPGIEEVVDDLPELVAFLSPKPPAQKKIQNGDLAAVLVAKGLLTQADVDAWSK